MNDSEFSRENTVQEQSYIMRPPPPPDLIELTLNSVKPGQVCSKGKCEPCEMNEDGACVISGTIKNLTSEPTEFGELAFQRNTIKDDPLVVTWLNETPALAPLILPGREETRDLPLFSIKADDKAKPGEHLLVVSFTDKKLRTSNFVRITVKIKAPPSGKGGRRGKVFLGVAAIAGVVALLRARRKR